MNLKNIQLKNNNNFVVKFPEAFDIKEWSIQKINRPKFTDYKWECIKIDFIDPIEPSTSQSLFNVVEFLKVHRTENNYIFDILIQTLNPSDGELIEQWKIKVKEVLIINFGELDYADDKTQQPYMIIEPLDCILD